MNPNGTNKRFNRLGLAMRAGKVVLGDSAVLDAIRSGEAKLVLLATDASANAAKKYTDKCSFYRTPLLSIGTRVELGSAIGKQERVVVAIIDTAFAELISRSDQKPPEVE